MSLKNEVRTINLGLESLKVYFWPFSITDNIQKFKSIPNPGGNLNIHLCEQGQQTLGGP